MTIKEIDLPEGSGEEFMRVAKLDGGEMTMSFVPSVILENSNGDPGIFGIVLADLAQHVANALDGMIAFADAPGGSFRKLSRDEIFARVASVLREELEKPSATPTRIARRNVN